MRRYVADSAAIAPALVKDLAVIPFGLDGKHRPAPESLTGGDVHRLTFCFLPVMGGYDAIRLLCRYSRR